jgi:hypothetical protein
VIFATAVNERGCEKRFLTLRSANVADSEMPQKTSGAKYFSVGKPCLTGWVSTAKPSWKERVWRESDSCPWWYADLQRDSHREFWTRSYGEDFYDWYMQTQVESAKEQEQERSPAIQLSLPGLAASQSYQESYLVDSF